MRSYSALLPLQWEEEGDSQATGREVAGAGKPAASSGVSPTQESGPVSPGPIHCAVSATMVALLAAPLLGQISPAASLIPPARSPNLGPLPALMVEASLPAPPQKHLGFCPISLDLPGCPFHWKGCRPERPLKSKRHRKSGSQGPPRAPPMAPPQQGPEEEEA